MEESKKKNKKIIVISIISVVVLIAIIGIVVFFITNTQKLKLYNATIELGQENYIEELAKQENVYIKEGYTYSVKDNKIDINNVGTYELTFEIKGKGETTEEIKQIQVQDTTPPTIELKKDTFYIGDSINIEEIITIKDLSQAEEMPYNEANVQTEGQFDTSKEGVSTIKVSATDKNGVSGTQEIKINVKNPIVNLYDYIEQKLKEDKIFSNGSYDNKFVIKFNESYMQGLTSNGWINFTDKVSYEYSKLVDKYGTVTTADLSYFDDNYKVNKVYSKGGMATGILAVDQYIKGSTPNGFTLVQGDLSIYQIDTDLSRINNVLNNKSGKIVLINKTVEQLKNETIDLREMQ